MAGRKPSGKIWNQENEILMPQFNDFKIALGKKEVTMMSHFSPAKQAEGFKFARYTIDIRCTMWYDVHQGGTIDEH